MEKEQYDKLMEESIKEWKREITLRQVINFDIIRILTDYIKKYPDLRFIQLLYDLGMPNYVKDEKDDTYSDKYNEESIDTLKRIKSIITKKIND